MSSPKPQNVCKSPLRTNAGTHIINSPKRFNQALNPLADLFDQRFSLENLILVKGY